MQIRRIVNIAVTMTMLSTLCGCEHIMDTELYLPNDFRSQLSPSMLYSAKVEKGKLETNMRFPLTSSATNAHSYIMEKKKLEENGLKYGAVFERINVAVGSYVKEGDLLVEFSSEDLDSRTKEVKAAIKEYEEEGAYLRKMAGADHSTDYSKQIKLADKQVEYNKELLKGIEKEYRSINIYAEEDGIVEYMNEDAQKGILVTNVPMIRTKQLSNSYYLSDETGKIKELFKTGETYNVSSSKLDDIMKVKCSKIEESQDGAGKVYFETVDPIEKDCGILYVELEGIKKDNVIYVNRDFVYNRSGDYFAYVAGDDGLLEMKKIQIGDQVAENFIILDGLKENDKVYKPGSWIETDEGDKTGNEE